MILFFIRATNVLFLFCALPSTVCMLLVRLTVLLRSVPSAAASSKVTVLVCDVESLP